MNKRKRLRRTVLLLLFLCSALFLQACSPQQGQPSEGTSSEPDTEESRENEAMAKCNYSGTDYAITQVNPAADAGTDGILYFDRAGGKAVLPPSSVPYTDIAVSNGVVCAVFENTPAAVPEYGFVLRVRNTELKRPPEPGIPVRTPLYTEPYRPETYVSIGGKTVEVRYRNIVRIADNAGFLFDGGWYNSTTRSNIYGTEIAVNAEGEVVEVNPSGTETSGNTFIPEGGYVLAVGQGTTYEQILKTAQPGDKAELVEEQRLYTVRKYTVDKTASSVRPDSGILYVSHADAQVTPGGAGTDVLVDADGIITAVIPNTEGTNPIPENGFALCASGAEASSLSVGCTASSGDLCVLSGAKVICIIRNPFTLRNQLGQRLREAEASLREAKENLAFINYAAADKCYADAETCLRLSETDPQILPDAERLPEELETELIPSFPFGERAAWVTVGENDAEGNPYLHYNDKTSVERTVAYAKRLNLTTLIIDPVASGYAVYPSSVRGLLPHPELGSFDVVGAFAEACEEAKIDLVVMPSALLSVSAGSVYPENHYVNLYKAKRLKTQKGRTVDAYGTISMDPSDPVIRNIMTDMVTELVTNYPQIDGIQTDYIRYPLPVYYQAENYEDFGYSSPAAQAFEKQYGADPAALKISDPLWESWCEWRCDVITSFASEISAAARAAKADIRVSFTCFADAGDRKNYVYQQPELWAETGIADAVYPMIYQPTTEEQYRYAKEFAELSESTDVVLGIGAYVRATEQSMTEQLDMPRDLGFAGASVFTLRYICVCGYNGVFKAAWRNPVVRTEAERDATIQSRLGGFRYLFPDEPLGNIADRIPELALLSEDGIRSELEQAGIRNERLRQTLAEELRYIGRYVF